MKNFRWFFKKCLFQRVTERDSMLSLLNINPVRRRCFSALAHLKTDLEELNSFYSDLFQNDSSAATVRHNELDEIDELNREINEFFNNKTVVEEVKPTLKTKFQTSKPLIVISNSNDPMKNLSLEELIFQNTPVNAKRLLFYVNSPCVVIGKNQNPYKEVNLSYLRSNNIPLIRRKSGGGTVVHDLGNVNYSYITSRQDFNRNYLGSVIIEELHKSGILKESLKLNHKSDIITELNGFKISGSAFKISKGKSLHHGTMLLNSNLVRLGACLKKEFENGENIEIRCNSVDSIPSKVTNLNIDNEDFIDVVTNGFLDVFNDPDVLKIEEQQINEEEDLIQLQNELKSWDWTYGKTPNFESTLTKNDLQLDLTISKGLITKLNILKCDDPDKYFDCLNNLNNVINGQNGLKFDGLEISNYLNDDALQKWFQRLI